MIIKFKKLNKNTHEPVYGTNYSAGADLRACLEENVEIKPGEVQIVGTGLACEIPENFFGMVCSRSGIAAKNGVVVLNSPGIIDSDYRGEIKLILINHSIKSFIIEHGMRLAQLIIVPFEKVSWQEIDELQRTQRNTGGLGSTGIR